MQKNQNYPAPETTAISGNNRLTNISENHPATGTKQPWSTPQVSLLNCRKSEGKASYPSETSAYGPS